MPRTEKKYPDWVQAYRSKGMTVKKKGNSFYLYKRTSRRVPGKKYPQPVDTDVGIITPEGVIKTHRKKVTLSDIEVWEYGFSFAMWELCPQGWKDAVGEEWEDVLKTIIIEMSPESYFKADYSPRSHESFHCAFGVQRNMLNRRLHRIYDKGFEELEPLKKLYLVKMGKEEAVSKVDDARREILDSFGLKLGD